MSNPRLRVAGTVFSTPDPDALAVFYERLLGWPRVMDDDGWIVLRPAEGGSALSFHTDERYVAPVWPSALGKQQMMMHLDIVTDDLDAAVVHAIECGATRHAHQTAADEVVMLDPDGHPFCLIRSEGW